MHHKPVIKHVYIAAAMLSGACLALSSCSLMFPAKTEPANRYVLNEVPVMPAMRRHDHILLVALPETSPMYDTRQIAYTDKPHRLAYYADNQWAATPAQMLQPLLVQTLQDTHHFSAVVSAPFQGHYDYQLNTQIQKLQIDFTRNPAMLNLTVFAQLISTSSNRLLAAREFSVSEPVMQANPYGGVMAANRAARIVLRQIAELCVRG